MTTMMMTAISCVGWRVLVAATMVWFGLTAAPALALTIDSDILLKLDLGTLSSSHRRGSSVDAPKKEPEVPVIRLSGFVQSGDAFRLRSILAKLKASSPKAPDKPLAIVELHSPGGEILEGFSLGYLFREFDVATVVRGGKFCLSACAIAFLGGTVSHLPPTVVAGRNIEIGGIVGFHNFYISPDSQKSYTATTTSEAVSTGFMVAQTTAAGMARYMAMMAIDPLFGAHLMERPASLWDYVDTAARFIDLNVCPMGLPARPVAAEVLASNICSNAFGSSASAGRNQVQAVTAPELKRRLLQYVSANPRPFRLRKSEIDRLGSAVAGGDARQLDALYDQLQDSGLPLPNVLGASFQVKGSGGDAGQYDLLCNISLSAADPAVFELVIEGPGGLSPVLNTHPVSCPILFAFNREDEINPAPQSVPRWDGPAPSFAPQRR
jgi:hypothetical protein